MRGFGPSRARPERDFMPPAMADLCPQCGADVRTSGTRCGSCGFWLPAAPAPRTAPPLPRPAAASRNDSSRRLTLAVLAVGGLVVLGLLAAGVMVWLRRPAVASAALGVAAAVAVPAASA